MTRGGYHGLRHRRRTFITDEAGQRAILHTARIPFVCFGCDMRHDPKTEYVAGQTLAGERVRFCCPCWLAGKRA